MTSAGGAITPDRIDASHGTASSRIAPIAGFWRRLGALALDSLLLGALGLCLGLLYFEQLATLGSHGRLLGGAIALVYFSILNSRIGGGRTLGKRALGIRVADAGGDAIGLARSSLRAFVLLLPFTLNGMDFPGGEPSLPLTIALTICVFGLGGSIVYLYLFNRHTRQSLHDLAAGTFVVAARASREVRGRVPKLHLAVVCGWLLTTAVAPGPLAHLFSQMDRSQDLLEMQHAVESIAPAARVSALRGATTVATLQDGRSSTEWIRIHVAVPMKPDSYESLADRIAGAILPEDPEQLGVAQVIIAITYGYDIMISQMSTNQTFTHTTQEWSERLKVRPRSESASRAPTEPDASHWGWTRSRGGVALERPGRRARGSDALRAS